MLTQEQKQSWEKWAHWGQSKGRSFPWTTGLSSSALLVSLALITVFHLLLAAHVPPSEDELYYWNWAQHLQWSYYDHPPMVALLIRLSTMIFGNSLLAIRLPACLIATLALFILTRITGESDHLILFVLTPFFLLGSILMTPDLPMILFWITYVYWLIGVNKTFSAWQENPVDRVYSATPVSRFRWGLGGIILGLGCLSKYSMALAVPCLVGLLASRYRFRSWVRGLLVHLFVAGIVMLPILFFNIQYHFEPVRFQWNHAMSSWHFSLPCFAEFVGVQALLVGALPFLLLPWCLVRAPQLCRDYRLQVCFWFFVPLILFFLFQATKGPLEANWPILAYVSFWPLAQAFMSSRLGRRIVEVSFIPPILCSILILIRVCHAIPALPPLKDRLGRMQAQAETERQIHDDLTDTLRPGEPVFATNYQLVSFLRYNGIPAEQVFPEGRRSNFTLQPKNLCRFPSVVVLQIWPPPKAANCFAHHEVIKYYADVLRKEIVGRYTLMRYEH